jgi:hypothetical protein
VGQGGCRERVACRSWCSPSWISCASSQGRYDIVTSIFSNSRQGQAVMALPSHLTCSTHRVNARRLQTNACVTLAGPLPGLQIIVKHPKGSAQTCGPVRCQYAAWKLLSTSRSTQQVPDVDAVVRFGDAPCIPATASSPLTAIGTAIRGSLHTVTGTALSHHLLARFDTQQFLCVKQPLDVSAVCKLKTTGYQL